MDMHPDSFEPGLWFSAKCLNTRTVRRAQLPGDVIGVALAHNLRRHNEGHRHRSKIAPELTPKNEVLRGSDCPLVGAELAAGILDELELRPGRSDAIMGIELVFQPPLTADGPDFWSGCLAWADGRYQHIISAVVHRDQARPHMHVVALAVHDGQLAGNALSSGVNRFNAQRRAFMAHMAKTLGLRPNRSKGKTLAQLAVSTGRGPKRKAEADKRDAEFSRKVASLRMGVGVHGGSAAKRVRSTHDASCMGVGVHGALPAMGLDPHALDPLNCAAAQPAGPVPNAQALADLAAVIGEWVGLDPAPVGGEQGAARPLDRTQPLTAAFVDRQVTGRSSCPPAYIVTRERLTIQARGP